MVVGIACTIWLWMLPCLSTWYFHDVVRCCCVLWGILSNTLAYVYSLIIWLLDLSVIFKNDYTLSCLCTCYAHDMLMCAYLAIVLFSLLFIPLVSCYSMLTWLPCLIYYLLIDHILLWIFVLCLSLLVLCLNMYYYLLVAYFVYIHDWRHLMLYELYILACLPTMIVWIAHCMIYLSSCTCVYVWAWWIICEFEWKHV